MFKSARGLAILSLSLAMIMIMNSFTYIEFRGDSTFRFQRLVTYLLTFFTIFNAGYFTNKYVQQIKDEKDDR